MFNAVVPARLESKRLKNKILKKIANYFIIEHVLNRLFLSKYIKKIFIVVNNAKLKKKIKKKNIKFLISKKKHRSGTSRALEYHNYYKSNYTIILFADEPSITPLQIDYFCLKILREKNKDVKIWNAVTNVKKKDLTSKDIVKCKISKNFITDYSRIDRKFKYKSVGIMGFKNNILYKLNNLQISTKERITKIEQFRYLENNFIIRSVMLKKVESSVNSYRDFVLVKKILDKFQQKKIIEKYKS